MQSVRLDAKTERLLAEASRITGQPVSQIIREAVAERCGLLLDRRLDQRLADVIGVVSSRGGQADRTGEAFAAMVKERREAASR